MKGHRLFDRFGFDLPKKDKAVDSTQTVIWDYQKWNFEPCLLNWYDEENNELLTDYQPPPELLALLENNINKELE
jgi:hypothetical protein